MILLDDSTVLENYKRERVVVVNASLATIGTLLASGQEMNNSLYTAFSVHFDLWTASCLKCVNTRLCHQTLSLKDN